jgi:sec-independent protein translocase protein TatC
MTLGAHLIEFRRRAAIAAAAVLVAAVAGWFVSDPLLSVIRAPLEAAAAGRDMVSQLNFDALTGAFDLRIRMAATIGIVASSPVWLYQLWAFLMPAMTGKERRYALGFVLPAVPLFLSGCAAGWVLLPHMVELLTGFVPDGATAFLRAGDYYTFVLKLTVAVGIAFVLPLLLVMLNFVGVLTGSAILHGWRIAVIAIALFAALATPSADVVSMFLLAAPMLGLYFIAAGISVVHDRRLARLALDL